MGVQVERQPVFNVPGIVLAFIAALVVVHGWREYLASDAQDALALATFGFVPGRWTYLIDPDGVADVFAGFTGPGATDREEIARYFLGDGSLQWWTPLTYGALHANWAHCGVNCLWLAAFGSPVARRIGPWRFAALFAVTSVAGAGAHWLSHIYDLQPVIGASASVSGLMAAATRFMFQSGGMIGLDSPQGTRPPLVPLPRLLRDPRAVPFLLVWFGVNFVFGIAAGPLGITPSPVAWEAHIGGFLAGLFMFHVFDPPAVIVAPAQRPDIPPTP